MSQEVKPEDLVDQADQLFRLANINRETASELETLAHKFMEKAVEIDAAAQKKRSAGPERKE